MEIQIKTFVTCADGKEIGTEDDKIAYEVHDGRFAVADGVSASYLPDIWAEIVADAFVHSSVLPETFQETLENGLFQAIQERWNSSSSIIEGEADDITARRLARTKRLLGPPATTLSGVMLDNNTLHYYILGDSCVFIINDTGLIPLSNVKDKNSFNNFPDYISLEEVVGTPLKGSTKLQCGWVILMTDGIAQWFWNQQEADTTTIERLWHLKNQTDFEQFVVTERQTHRLRNDDIAVILIKLTDQSSLTQPLVNELLPSTKSNWICKQLEWLRKLLKWLRMKMVKH
jgi:serine/threonine protein phosphatase PrpC